MSEEVNKSFEQNTQAAGAENGGAETGGAENGAGTEKSPGLEPTAGTLASDATAVPGSDVSAVPAASENPVAPNAPLPAPSALQNDDVADRKNLSQEETGINLKKEDPVATDAGADSETGLISDPDNAIVFGARNEYNEKPFPIKVFEWTVEEDFPEVPPPNFDLVISQEVLIEVNRHVQETLMRELGGFLLGNRYYCPLRKRDYIQIDNFSEAKFSSSDEVSLKLTHQTWDKLNADLDGKHRGKQLIGWYHSHPRMSVFLSQMDVKVHTEHFNDKYSVALVIEPEKMTGGFFCWRWNGITDPIANEKTLHQNARINFYELKDLTPDETCMPWLSEYSCIDGETRQAVRPRLSKTHFATSKTSDASLIQVSEHTPPTGTKTAGEAGPGGGKPQVGWLKPLIAGLFALILLAAGGYAYWAMTREDDGVAGKNQNSSLPAQKDPAAPAKPEETSKKLIIDKKKTNTQDKPYYLILTFPDEKDKENYAISLDDQKLELVDKDRVGKNRIDGNLKNNPKVAYYEIPNDTAKLKGAREGEDVIFLLKIRNKSDGDENSLYEDSVTVKIGSEIESQEPSPAELLRRQRARDEERQRQESSRRDASAKPAPATKPGGRRETRKTQNLPASGNPNSQ